MRGKATKQMVPHVKKKPLINQHHRFPRAQGGENWRPEINVVTVLLTQHRAWHTLFEGTLTPHDIAAIINTVWLDPRYKFVVERTDVED